MLSILNENCHPTEKQGTFHFIVGYFSLKKCALQSYQMTKKKVYLCCIWIKALISSILTLQLAQEMLQKYILFIGHSIIFELGTLLSHHHEGRQIWNFAKMSKSHSDGGFQCKLFLHINRSNEYTHYTISIPFEHFSGVSVVYRLSSA